MLAHRGGIEGGISVGHAVILPYERAPPGTGVFITAWH
jgi:hypothetical protein